MLVIFHTSFSSSSKTPDECTSNTKNKKKKKNAEDNDPKHKQRMKFKIETFLVFVLDYCKR